MKKLIAVAAFIAIGSAVTPASAASMCTSANMAKMNSSMGTMADSPNKTDMTREFYMANQSMSKGDMRDCEKRMKKISMMGSSKK